MDSAALAGARRSCCCRRRRIRHRSAATAISRCSARIKPGVTLTEAAADMDTVAAALERDFPNDNGNVGVALVTLRNDLVVDDVRSTTLLLFGAVGLLLLIATANVSGLLIARAQPHAIRRWRSASRSAPRATDPGAAADRRACCWRSSAARAGVLLAMWMVAGLLAASARRDLDRRRRGDASTRPSCSSGSCVSTLDRPAVRPCARAAAEPPQTCNDDLKQSARGGIRRRSAAHSRTCWSPAEIALSLVLLVAAGLTVAQLHRRCSA